MSELSDLALRKKGGATRYCGGLFRSKSADFVPYVASRSILLKIMDISGRLWEVRIFINYNGLEDKLHYCNKSRDIIMIVGFQLFCSLNVSLWSVLQTLRAFFYHSNSVGH